MKKLFLLLTLAFTINANSQDNKTVTLVVSGQGKTPDEAKQNALRSAIEQAFGTFISSKTELLNDNLVKDEIVSVANGNIQKFEVLSEVKIPEGGYATTLKAIVSVSKLTSFCESKGMEVDLKGSTFAMNIKLQKLNEVAEYKAVLNLCEVSKKILNKSIDYSIDVSEPLSYNGSSDLFYLKFNVTCRPNKNARIFENYFWETVSKLCMTNEEIDSYIKIQKQSYLVARSKMFFHNNDGGCDDCYQVNSEQSYGNIKDTISTSYYYLRNKDSRIEIIKLMLNSNLNLYKFKLMSEIDTIIMTKGNIEDVNRDGGRGDKEPSVFENWSVYSNKYYSFPECIFCKGNLCDTQNSSGNWFLRVNSIGYTPGNAGFGDGSVDKFELVNKNDIYIKRIENTNPIRFPYYHMLTLSKLEKISKYRIEPFDNELK
jgi:hypothetical protein